MEKGYRVHWLETIGEHTITYPESRIVLLDPPSGIDFGIQKGRGGG
jgi:hypothetical protein